VLSVTPAVRVDGPAGSATVRVNGTRFESGSASMQADASGAVLVGHAGAALRGELGATLGALWYGRRGPDSRDASVSARLRGDGPRGGVWAGAGAGGVEINGAGFGVARAGAGAWRRAGPASLQATVEGTAVGGAGYADTEGLVHLGAGRAALDLSAGWRTGERGGGVRGWGELGATLWVTRRVALVAAGGSYPADVARGAPGGRYAAVAARLTTARRFSAAEGAALARLRRLRARTLDDTSAHAPRAVELRTVQGLQRALRVRIPGSDGAAVVELMGNFTEWTPVPLARVAPDVWEVRLDLAPGVHRFNVRVDGGEWTVPPGAATGEDEFGGVAALLVVR
jgi:hypothetical protein